MGWGGLPIDLFVWVHLHTRSWYIHLRRIALGRDESGNRKPPPKQRATCQLMTNTVHFQPICFLCALDEVSDESNLGSAPCADKERYVSGRGGLRAWASWWMRAIIDDACKFNSVRTFNIGLTPKTRMSVCLCTCACVSILLSLSLSMKEEVVCALFRAKIYCSIIVVAL